MQRKSGTAVSADERLSASGQIRLRELSVFNRPLEQSVMLVVKGYADDTRQAGQTWVIAGYAATADQWDFFENQWRVMLARHGVPWFHKREMGEPDGVYAKWFPLKDHPEELDAFFADMVRVIHGHRLQPFFSVVRIGDLERFNAETGLNLQPYPLAAYGCALSLVQHGLGPLDTAEIFFDRVEKVAGKLAQATEYAEADTHFVPQVYERSILVPLNNDKNFKRLMPLQAADFIAWEVQKFHLDWADEWYRLPDKPTDYGERWLHSENWRTERYGTKVPPARKSLVALAGGASPLGKIWGYDTLKEIHRLRRGVWSLGEERHGESIGRTL